MHAMRMIELCSFWSEESTSQLSRVTCLGIGELGIIHLVHNI